MSVRIMTLGDPHFRLDSFSLTRSDQMTQAFLRLCREIRPDAIVNLGDTLDRHSTMDMQARCRAVRFLWELQSIVPLYVLIGNHDRINNQEFLTDVHPFPGEKQWPQTYIIDTIQEHTIRDCTFLMVPYVKEDRIHEALRPYAPVMSSYKAVFSHIEVQGCKMGSIVSEADEWIYPVPLITGHVHEKQRVGPLVSYPGTPMHMSFGEKGTKTVSEYVFTDAPVENHWCQTEQGCVAEIEYDLGLPPLQTLYMTTSEFLSYRPKGDVRYTRFSLRGSETEIRKVKCSQRYIDWLGQGVRIAFPKIRQELDPPTEFPSTTFEESVEEAIRNQEEKVRMTWDRLKPELLAP